MYDLCHGTSASREAPSLVDENPVSQKEERPMTRPVTGSVRFVPGAGDLGGLHEQSIPQKDQLCGAFWGALVYDPERPGRLSAVESRFAAGILADLPALCAFTAPSVVSYLRLVPHFWSAGFGCLEERNRESTIRIPPIVELTSGAPARQFNLEFRAADAAACPHLVLAGLRGLQDELPEPTLIEQDPTGLDEEERWRLGISELPGSLDEALDALATDEVVRSWFSSDLWDCYLSVKR
jgi:glutamine synthetase